MAYLPRTSHRMAAVYIAGPQVLYRGGTDELLWMRRFAEARGFEVTLPNDHALALGNADPRLDADAILAGCAESMNRSDTLICDLDFYRGTEPDGGSVFEIGMAYGRGMRIIGFTNDKRSMAVKDPGILLKDGEAYDAEGRRFTYAELPFAPSVIGSSTIVEGDFQDAVAQLVLELEKESKDAARRGGTPPVAAPAPPVAPSARPRVYLAGADRYRSDAAAYYRPLKALGERLGWDVVTPLDPLPGVEPVITQDRWTDACLTFDRCQQHVRDCDLVIADLNDYHGREPSSDVAFECGLGFQLGKRLFGYMNDTRRMIERIPNLGPEREYADLAAAKAENFDYPINLMFASTMPIFQGPAESAMQTVAEALGSAQV